VKSVKYLAQLLSLPPDVAWFLFAPLFVLGVALYVMSDEERKRSFQAAVVMIRGAIKEATRRRPELEPFRDSLRARTSRVIVTPALVALNATIFVFMLFGAGSLSDPATLVGWGANYGPRTTNGEWWRLVTTMFVHAGILHLLVNIAGLVQCGLMLERLVGHLAFAAVYVAAGTFGSLALVSAHPLAVMVGASEAIFGVYGLLFALLIPTLLHRSTIAIPLMALKRAAPAALLFILYNYDVMTGAPEGQVKLTAFLVGFFSGCALSVWRSDGKPAVRRLATVVGVTAVLAAVSAVPLRGVFDARPELARVVAFEDRTAAAYQKEVDRFKGGRASIEKLSQLIEKTIVPELQATRTRMKSLAKAPAEQQLLIASAEEYLRLRDESWRLRAEGLRKANLVVLREAERTERASLEALRRVKFGDTASSERSSP
jgi:membrane associated rhomboid family serine protease